MNRTVDTLVLLAGAVSILVGTFVLTVCLSTGSAPGAGTPRPTPITTPRR